MATLTRDMKDEFIDNIIGAMDKVSTPDFKKLIAAAQDAVFKSQLPAPLYKVVVKYPNTIGHLRLYEFGPNLELPIELRYPKGVVQEERRGLFICQAEKCSGLSWNYLKEPLKYYHNSNALRNLVEVETLRVETQQFIDAVIERCDLISRLREQVKGVRTDKQLKQLSPEFADAVPEPSSKSSTALTVVGTSSLVAELVKCGVRFDAPKGAVNVQA